MPFKSEKQRRYLWANEPEIARDWTDTYGSGIHKALGGRIPFAEGSKKTSVVERNLANKKAELNFWEEQKDTPEKEEKIAQIQADIDRLKGDIGTAADTLLGSGEVPTKGITSKILEFILGSPAEGSIATEQERIALMESMKGTTADPDFLYSPRGSQGIMDPSLVQPHGWEFGNQWQTAEEEDDSGNWLVKALSYMPLVGKNTRSGALMRMLTNKYMPDGGITSMFNRPTTPQQQATQRFMQNYNVGRNPQTGRMTSGPFAGMNAPGTSMFGSQTPQQMAQKWMKKYGKMNYQTRKQQLKQQQIKNIATMNKGPAGTTPKAPTRPVHSGQPTGGHHEGGGGGIGSTASSQGPAGGSVGASRFRSRGGRLYNTGGLVSLWQR